ncbi:hypothetical protein QR680_003337 [Steinernema hermaphroditum]|uniref:DDE Tnp4 domain-containing protein n=1 Tax=Steinernema hermaphroditum TaxID=289476 RepID=A0AA39H8X6_9BILA|nr:hypothetical protein QR680_003337 [Steinernema hermaphroditum]
MKVRRRATAAALALCRFLLSRKRRRQRTYIRGSHERHQEQRFDLFTEYYNSEEDNDLRQYIRFGRQDFDSLHEILKSQLQKARSHRFPLTSQQRLTVFLRFIAHGPSYRCISTTFGIGVATVQRIIIDVTKAILEAIPLRRPNTADLIEVAERFEHRWQFPNCVAALDGKHFLLEAPCAAGSLYFNYKLPLHSRISLGRCRLPFLILRHRLPWTTIRLLDLRGQSDSPTDPQIDSRR